MKLNISEFIPPPPDRSKKEADEYDEEEIMPSGIRLKTPQSAESAIPLTRIKDTNDSDMIEPANISESAPTLPNATPSGSIDVDLSDLEEPNYHPQKKVPFSDTSELKAEIKRQGEEQDKDNAA